MAVSCVLLLYRSFDMGLVLFTLAQISNIIVYSPSIELFLLFIKEKVIVMKYMYASCNKQLTPMNDSSTFSIESRFFELDYVSNLNRFVGVEISKTCLLSSLKKLTS